MKKEVWYRQCTYKRETENGVKVGTSWIPENLAVVGKEIYFGKKTKTPKELWVVTGVGARQSESYLNERSQDYKNQRKASDI